MKAGTQDTVLHGKVQELSDDGGIVCVDDKRYLIDGVLPHETVTFTPHKKHRGKFRGVLVQVIEPSADRVQPRCEYFGVCGGCARQHIAADAQIKFKEEILLQHLTVITGTMPQQKLPPVRAADGHAQWHYRRKARPGIRYVPKKGGVLIGFRERRRNLITSLMHCETLDARLSKLLPDLHELLTQCACRERVPQIEMAAADNAVALVLRHLDALTVADIALFKQFATAHDVQFFLQSGGPDTVTPLSPASPAPLFYRLDDYDLTLHFAPTDFIQVNGAVNARLVATAMALLSPQRGECIADLFCGIGNFTLPIARSGARVIGVEGDARLTRRGTENAAHNHITNAEFHCADLYRPEINLALQACDKLLLDPPRSGASGVINQCIPNLRAKVIVYVSCNPETLARDAHSLINAHGYQLTHAGVVDMFPHTAQVESVARFEKV